MKFHRTYGFHMKHLFFGLALSASLLLTACGSSDTAGTQARTDLTSDHVRGLYSGMVRSDVEDLLGTGDKSLAEHESIDVYSLSDGTTAVLRYRDDTLMGAYLRDKDNIETSIFGRDQSNMSDVNGVNDTNGNNYNSGNSSATEGTTSGPGNNGSMGGDSMDNNSSLGNSDLNNTDDSTTEAFGETYASTESEKNR